VDTVCLIAVAIIALIVGGISAVEEMHQEERMSDAELAERDEFRRRVQIMDWYDRHKK
jgi:hypothetical protein